MDGMWHTVKEYFTGSNNPLQFCSHLCELDSYPGKNNNTEYGVELDEDCMRIFSALGDVSRPPCTCNETRPLCDHIDAYIKNHPEHHSKDYTIHTDKGDTCVEEVCRYVMRDVLQWWAHWNGFIEGHRWKHLYIAFVAIVDEIAIPPQDVADGSFRLLGNSLADVLEGLRLEGVHPDDIKLLEMYLWRQCIIQYLEKVDPAIRQILIGKATLMTLWRVLTAGTHGVAVCILTSKGIRPQGQTDHALEMASACDAISMDMGKEALGILQDEPTETVAGKDREMLKRELRWVYLRALGSLDQDPRGAVLRRFATSGWHYVLLNDRYRERVAHVRFPMSPYLRCRIAAYYKSGWYS
ncbi:uncharacterized protein BO88DRAFT_328877 [Aspergillus vadensis CBS 113365]|uniref:Uncharacterized protein n=1 Tax=Aspergillus vadensis (strain CBS 113365 / IMI 142717 / IBT 24658) TaxID=1448311 RepID=A0A319BRN7_ASPVC|nr:hypothetical protein BO88DRAFT_328877 [Aspergillus vadensis CBS 113365]PYH75081.1 hypothetical protein BO88DRAFT_328877 [Aspergillus vadensis CBS 113365]